MDELPHIDPSKGLIGLNIIQPSSDYTFMTFRVKKLITLRRSHYQEIVIADVEDFGRSLILDNFIQSSEVDEYIYHETLVHPVMVAHPNPEKVLIIGGGEGATLREVLKHSVVRKAVMVDIDKDVVELSKKYLEKWHQGAFDDPRAEIVITAGRKYVEETSEKFDVIILDLTDPYGIEISKKLYSAEFYSMVYNVLEDDGLMVTQAGSAFFYEKVYDSVLKSIKKVFPVVVEYNVWVPVFGYANNFIVGSKKYDPSKLDAEDVERILKTRNVKTKFYNGKTHIALMYTPIFRASGCVKR